MAGTITISGMQAGLPAGENIFGPVTITGKIVIGETLELPLASGDNTIAVPTTAVAVVIRGPSTNTTPVKLRTSKNSSDAGLQLCTGTTPTVYRFPATPPTSLILHASAAISAPTMVLFI